MTVIACIGLTTITSILCTVLVLRFIAGPVFLNSLCNNKYAFTSPELDCNFDDVAARLNSLDHTFDDTAETFIKEGKATKVSVWVRDLKSKQWAAVNENEEYSPASLLKLPLMIAYFKYAQLDPTILKQALPYQSTATDTTLYFTKKSSLIIGHLYPIQELIERMMIDSDNGAADTLLAKFGTQNFTQILLDLGIKIPQNGDTVDFVTVHTYATIVRTLYNASYLNREYSQKALEIMTRSSFKGIASVMPKNVAVAHKFGERTVINNKDGSVEERELHDCGIVFAKTGAYTLCIMTEGTNFDDLLQVIQGMAKVASIELQTI